MWRCKVHNSLVNEVLAALTTHLTREEKHGTNSDVTVRKRSYVESKSGDAKLCRK